jgi:hypothetical protein
MKIYVDVDVWRSKNNVYNRQKILGFMPNILIRNKCILHLAFRWKN